MWRRGDWLPDDEFDQDSYIAGHEYFSTDEVFGDNPFEDEYLDKVWSRIESFPDYFISDAGDVWSTLTNRFIKHHVGPNGYAYVPLRFNGRTVKRTIHRLLAEAFIFNDAPADNTIVRHLDDNRDNLEIANLSWGTYKDNYEDSVLNGRSRVPSRYTIHAAIKKNSKAVEIRGPDNDEWMLFSSQAEAARYLRVHPANITLCLNGTISSVCGYEIRRCGG